MGSSAVLRRKVFASLRSADFSAWAIVVDKTTLPDPFKVIRRLGFYLFLSLNCCKPSRPNNVKELL